MKHADHNLRAPADIQTSIEQTREEMSATIDAIQRRLTPGQLMDQTLGYLRHSLPADFGANLANTVRDNPVPVTLIGVGIAWLAMSGQSTEGYAGSGRRRAGQDHDDRDSALHRAATTAGDAAEGIKDKASEVAGRARAVARDARDRVTSTAEDARDRLRDLSDRSQDQYERARRTVANLFDEQPLVMGALGVAIGAAIGAALPSTRTEDEMLGEASDDLVDSAKASADEYARRARDSVREAVDHVEEKVDAGPGGSVDDVNRTASPSPRAQGQSTV